MKRIAVLLAAFALVGWASPLLAGTPDGCQVFYVTVYEDGAVRDTGFLRLLPNDGSGYLRLQTWWFGKGAWKEKGEWELLRDYGQNGCAWEGWYSSSVSPPYDEFEGAYYTPWGDRSRAIVFGWVQPLNQHTDLWFYGELLSW